MTAINAKLEEFVQAEISSGRFPNRESVVVHALQLFQRERSDAVNGIRLGLEDVEAGRVQPLGDAFADLRREFNVPQERHPSGCYGSCEPG